MKEGFLSEMQSATAANVAGSIFPTARVGVPGLGALRGSDCWRKMLWPPEKTRRVAPAGGVISCGPMPGGLSTE